MTDTIGSIQERGYEATLDEIKELGALSVGAERLKTTIGTTYLRALVRTAYNVSIGHASPLDSVSAAHSTLYRAVLEGVATPDVAPLKRDGSAATRDANKARSLERNSRSNFARTACSALTTFVGRGGDLAFLVANIEHVTKTFLQGTQPNAPAEIQNAAGRHWKLAPSQEVAVRAELKWWKAVAQLKALDTDATRAYLTRVQERIASEIASL